MHAPTAPRRARPGAYNAKLARLFDVGFALLGLIVLSPVIVVTSLAILAETGRPILFAQTRLGRHGKHFTMLKFRKFSIDAKGLRSPLTLKDDARMTRVGRLLAATKLDELPQLVNILRGEMAVVGPRPESLELEDCFTEASRPVLAHKPGIFGPSQWAFRNENALFPADADPVAFYREVIFPLKARLDLAYYARRTLVQDLKWIVLCCLAVAGVHPDTTLVMAAAGLPDKPPLRLD